MIDDDEATCGCLPSRQKWTIVALVMLLDAFGALRARYINNVFLLRGTSDYS